MKILLTTLLYAASLLCWLLWLTARLVLASIGSSERMSARKNR